MADIELVVKISEEDYQRLKAKDKLNDMFLNYYEKLIVYGTPLTPDMLADMLMEERIRGELKQDITYSKDIIDNVRCKLSVDIIDRRPCFCGAELREVWRESEEK